MTTVVLARHGETTWNRDRRVQGWAATELTATGREQADAVGEHIASAYDVDRVVSSDLHRALETARRVRSALPAAPELERAPAWRERDFGALQGLSYDELFSRFPEFAVLDAGYTAATARPAGGERWIDARARTLRAADELVAELTESEEGGAPDREAGEDAAGEDEAAGERTTVVVTHGGPIRHVLASLLGLDVAETIVELEPGNCSVTELCVDGSIELPPEPEDGVYEPSFPAVTTIERQSECAFLDAAAEAD